MSRRARSSMKVFVFSRKILGELARAHIKKENSKLFHHVVI